jgi:hypothetical protein
LCISLFVTIQNASPPAAARLFFWWQGFAAFSSKTLPPEKVCELP